MAVSEPIVLSFNNILRKLIYGLAWNQIVTDWMVVVCIGIKRIKIQMHT